MMQSLDRNRERLQGSIALLGEVSSLHLNYFRPLMETIALCGEPGRPSCVTFSAMATPGDKIKHCPQELQCRK
jgi:hypothetical protein